ncbi:VSP [Giardia duodenalis]|nr:VSP [Giardia intestinalis]KAE8304195.1 VSP [Giardia intestinalis]
MLVGIGLIFAVALADACSPSIDGCAECDSTGKKCTKCDANGNTPYLKKTNPSDPTGTCVSAVDCQGSAGYYTDDSVSDAKECKKCNAPCTACAGTADKCTKCDANGAAPYLKKTNPSDPTGTCVSAVDCQGSAGYYTDDSVSDAKECKKCNAPCTACAGTADKCTKCDANGAAPYLKKTNPSDPTGTCVSAVDCQGSAGYYTDDSVSDAKECKKCNAPCTACAGTADKCTKCDANGAAPYLKKTNPSDPTGTCVSAVDCQGSAGYYTDDSVSDAKECKKCNAPCTACAGTADKCTKCDANGAAPYLKKTNPSDPTGTCVSAVDCQGSAGYYTDDSVSDAKECKKCNAPCTACAGTADKCTKCDANGAAPYLKKTNPSDPTGTCVSAVDCQGSAGYYTDDSVSDAKECKKCNAPCTACAGTADKCTKCDANGAAPYLKKTNPSDPTGTCVSAVDCQGSAGYYTDDSVSDAKECKKCNAPCTACAGTADKCTKCDANGAAPYLKKTNPSDPTGTCVSAVDCQGSAGYYTDDSVSDAKECKKCNAPCTACAGTADKCTKCDANGAAPYLKKTNPSDPTGTCVSAVDCQGSAGYYTDDSVSDAKECKKCNAPCTACAGTADKCTKCDANGAAPYLKKTNPSDPTGTCVSAVDCQGSAGYYTDDSVSDAKECKKCNAPCTACAGTADKCTKCDANGAAPYLKKTNPSDPTGTCVSAVDCQGSAGYYTDDSVSDAKECKKCAEGQKPNTAGTQCFSCSDANCERCDQNDVCARCSTGAPPENGKCPAATPGCHSSCDGCTENAMTNQADKCTGCKEGRYLKPESAAGQSGACLTAEECTSDKTHFTREKAGDSKGMCLSCSDATHGITGCKKCALKTLSGEAESTVVCSECTDKRLTPSGNACLDNCPAGTYADNINGVSVCASCHATCAECNGDANAASCTACYPGYSLLYGSGTAGTCVKECTGAFITNCADGQCTANVGGAKYCAQCKDGYAPIDGICTTVAAAGRDASVCTAADGKCTKCAGEYTLMSGGCYGVAKLPGKSVCTLASNGKCTMCAANNQAPVQEKCPECSEGCAKCNDSNACTECLPGYYKGAGDKCFKCTASSGNNNQITGVANCVSCAPPAGGNGGPVTCYIKTDGDNTGGSVNKSGLSTGAIAGISVAVVVVVGGLVGFLCWWFICRGKA